MFLIQLKQIITDFQLSTDDVVMTEQGISIKKDSILQKDESLFDILTTNGFIDNDIYLTMELSLGDLWVLLQSENNDPSIIIAKLFTTLYTANIHKNIMLQGDEVFITTKGVSKSVIIEIQKLFKAAICYDEFIRIHLDREPHHKELLNKLQMYISDYKKL